MPYSAPVMLGWTTERFEVQVGLSSSLGEDEWGEEGRERGIGESGWVPEARYGTHFSPSSISWLRAAFSSGPGTYRGLCERCRASSWQWRRKVSTKNCPIRDT